MSLLEISLLPGEDGPVIVVTGEADFQGVAELEAALASELATGTSHIVIDVSGLRFADSPTVRTLVLAARELRQRGGVLVLDRPQSAVARILELMGADQMMRVETGLEAEDSTGGT